MDGRITEANSSITQTAESIRQEIEKLETDLDGRITEANSSITQTAESIRTEVSETIGNLGEYSSVSSMIEQTASSIRNEISGFVDGDYVSNSITTALDGLALEASSANGTTVLKLMGGEAVLSTKELKLSVDAANITGKLVIGQLPSGVAKTEDIPSYTSDLVNDTGYVTDADIPTKVSQLRNDLNYVTPSGITTIIDGVITTDFINALGVTAAYVSAEGIEGGWISAKNGVKLDGLMEMKNGSYYGYVGVNNVRGGAVLSSGNQNVYVIANDTTAKMSSYEEHMIWVHTSGCFSTDTIQISSDRTLKDNISYDLSAEEKLFGLLQPCSFSYISDKNSKKHWGFIAQDFIGGAQEVGMETDKMAVLGEYEGKYSIGYGEITALNTHMIQRLMSRVEALESRREE